MKKKTTKPKNTVYLVFYDGHYPQHFIFTTLAKARQFVKKSVLDENWQPLPPLKGLWQWTDEVHYVTIYTMKVDKQCRSLK